MSVYFLQRLMNEWYRDLLRIKIEKRIIKLIEITGVEQNEWQVQTMKTKWGSCNPNKKRLLFNL